MSVGLDIYLDLTASAIMVALREKELTFSGGYYLPIFFDSFTGIIILFNLQNSLTR